MENIHLFSINQQMVHLDISYSEKYLIENEKKEIIIKWFENSPYGISFKVKVIEKSL